MLLFSPRHSPHKCGSALGLTKRFVSLLNTLINTDERTRLLTCPPLFAFHHFEPAPPPPKPPPPRSRRPHVLRRNLRRRAPGLRSTFRRRGRRCRCRRLPCGDAGSSRRNGGRRASVRPCATPSARSTIRSPCDRSANHRLQRGQRSIRTTATSGTATHPPTISAITHQGRVVLLRNGVRHACFEFAAREHGRHGFDAAHHAAVVVAFAEGGQHIIHLDAFAERVGQHALDAAPRHEADFALLPSQAGCPRRCCPRGGRRPTSRRARRRT